MFPAKGLSKPEHNEVPVGDAVGSAVCDAVGAVVGDGIRAPTARPECHLQKKI